MIRTGPRQRRSRATQRPARHLARGVAGDGFTTLELLVALAIIGAVGSAGLLFLPRDRFDVNQAAQVASQAVQFARFEAVKEDRSVRIDFALGSPDAVVRTQATSETIRTFPLDPSRSNAVEVVALDPVGTSSVVFNARGVATNLLGTGLTVTLKHAATTYAREIHINLIGDVTIQ